jgi:hypothetical protein
MGNAKDSGGRARGRVFARVTTPSKFPANATRC